MWEPQAMRHIMCMFVFGCHVGAGGIFAYHQRHINVTVYLFLCSWIKWIFSDILIYMCVCFHFNLFKETDVPHVWWIQMCSYLYHHSPHHQTEQRGTTECAYSGQVYRETDLWAAQLIETVGDGRRGFLPRSVSLCGCITQQRNMSPSR